MLLKLPAAGAGMALLTLALLTLSLLSLAACKNLAEERRESLRESAGASARESPEARAAAIETAMRILARQDPESVSTTMRWQAAQNLGTLGAVEAYDLLVQRSLAGLADDNEAVRRECIISLSKLPYGGPSDPKRRMLVAALKDRVAFERSETASRKLLESDPTVRFAMLDAIITLGKPRPAPGTFAPTTAVVLPDALGYRDCAEALHAILSLLYAQRGGVSDSAFSIADSQSRINAGLMEAAVGGLTILTRTDPGVVADRRRTLSREDFIKWWTGVMEKLPVMGGA